MRGSESKRASRERQTYGQRQRQNRERKTERKGDRRKQRAGIGPRTCTSVHVSRERGTPSLSLHRSCSCGCPPHYNLVLKHTLIADAPPTAGFALAPHASMLAHAPPTEGLAHLSLVMMITNARTSMQPHEPAGARAPAGDFVCAGQITFTRTPNALGNPRDRVATPRSAVHSSKLSYPTVSLALRMVRDPQT
jgi:hypothetical protein